MLRKIAFLILIAFFAFVPLVLDLKAQAQSNPVVAEVPPSSQPAFRSGSKVVIEGEQFGHVYVVAGQVIVRGVVNGDLIVMAGSVRIEGVVTEDVYVAAGSVVVSGSIHGQLTMAAGEVVLTEESTVGKSVVAVGESLRLAGDVTSPSYVRARRLDNAAGISGDLSQWKKDEQDTRSDVSPVALSIVRTLSTVLLALISWWWFGPVIQKVSQKLDQDWRAAAIKGMTVVIMIPIFAMLLMITLVGAPVGFVIGLAYFALLSISSVVPMCWVGQKVWPKGKGVWQIVVGAFIVGALTQLPLLGWIFSILAATLGAGAILRFVGRET